MSRIDTFWGWKTYVFIVVSVKTEKVSFMNRWGDLNMIGSRGMEVAVVSVEVEAWFWTTCGVGGVWDCDEFKTGFSKVVW